LGDFPRLALSGCLAGTSTRAGDFHQAIGHGLIELIHCRGRGSGDDPLLTDPHSHIATEHDSHYLAEILIGDSQQHSIGDLLWVCRRHWPSSCIERGERRVDYDDLLALAYVLKVCPVDLMVNKEAATEPYSVTPDDQFESGSVRDWIGGQTVVLHRPSGPVFAEPSAVMFDALKWMPRQRRAAVLKNVLHMEEEEL
jgi:hypothetical protein